MELKEYFNNSIELAKGSEDILIPDYMSGFKNMIRHDVYRFTVDKEPCYPILTNYYCSIIISLRYDIWELIENGTCQQDDVKKFLSDNYYEDSYWLNNLKLQDAVQVLREHELQAYFGRMEELNSRIKLQDIYKVRLELTFKCLFLIWYCINLSNNSLSGNSEELNFVTSFTVNMCAHFRYEWMTSEMNKHTEKVATDYLNNRRMSGKYKNKKNRDRGLELIREFYSNPINEGASIADAIRYVQTKVFKYNTQGDQVPYDSGTIRKWVTKYLNNDKR